MKSLSTRLNDAERRMGVTGLLPVRCYYVKGNDPDMEVEDFLREHGHDMDAPSVLHLIHKIVSARDGKPVIV